MDRMFFQAGCDRKEENSMLIHDLSGDECVKVLQGTSVGHLACARDGEPYVVPIHFAFDPDRRCVYGVSMLGQKVEWMRANPRACLAVTDITDKHHWETVIIAGTYEELRDAPDADDAERRCQELFERNKEWWFPAMATRPAHQPRSVILFRIRIDHMTGRRAARSDRVPAGRAFEE
jgi:nitroimidazol reductase NimA-like FMN-containing flavoprotein (pyridoxamine 5'-phosphate oxidase superfamily)